MKELCKAMSQAFPLIEGAVKDKENPHYRSKYADLGNVVDAIKPALSAYGLWFIQTVHNVPNFASVETIIMHSSGESLSCGITSVPVTKNDAQGYGSALTYARRYSLSSAFGVAPEDDDGNKACEGSKKEKPPANGTKEIVQVFSKLTDKELKTLADDTVGVLGLMPDEIPAMLACLKDWQDKNKSDKSIREIVVAKRQSEDEFCQVFERWKSLNQDKLIEKV